MSISQVLIDDGGKNEKFIKVKWKISQGSILCYIFSFHQNNSYRQTV